ncbi:hypothetical protein GCM10017687_00950 [Streptomyces echinatus]|uniref:hypothetical protein n=1 Tax=Streptomyces echinatus TaxID=67293 RepID=UPI0031EEBBD9
MVPIAPSTPATRHCCWAPDGAPATGDEGELCVAGPQLTPGYLDPADDTGRFLERDGHRFYRTGDRVRRAGDGGLLYLGRQDAQVQVHGVRVEPAEVDAAARTCPGVEDAVTVAVPVDGTVELAVFHTARTRAARPARPPSAGGAAGRRRPACLPPPDALPLNSNRKTDRRKLASRATAMRRPAGAAGTHERRARVAVNGQPTAAGPHRRPAARPARRGHRRVPRTPPAVTDGAGRWTYRELAAHSHAVDAWLEETRHRPR